MEIKDMFKKDITRNIEGVVMIGNEDEDKRFQELDEYVCTDEITKNFRRFFSAYRKALEVPTKDMGVWITGFFGSGKSHFLKILGYVLSNEEVHGKKAVDFFNDKIADPMLLADMRKSANADNLVILFNIDSKAKSDAKNRNTSIMETMLNCFNAKLGYCESITWLAEMERGLDKDGLFQKFIAHFNEISGKDYLAQRKNIFFLRDKFIQALSDIKGISLESARDFFDDSQKHFSLNTEQFANIIAEYCEKTGKHVIFLMDEVGQFIGSNSEMMLGLQTVVEDLGKQANGKAWVVVTSQQQIDALIEGTNHAAQMDFSKITGRFKTRLTMSSQNADEVIQKRLLEKTEDAANVLGTLYDEKADKLNNLLAFPANPKWTGYKDKEEFIKDYPFVNYQFELLQQVFDAIRDNGMSEGKSISSGERSLLSAFKDSAEAKCNQNIGILIPFNDFYKTADEFMDWNVKQVFARAARRMPDAFDIEVLKVLFMLKNVKEMEPTIERIATLMVSSIDEDKVSLKKKIKDSLDRLIAETFVQQNGDRYEFLTDEEQEANRKIKNSSYSQGDVYNKIRDIVYENILETGRNFSYNKYSFTLNRFIDENLIGTENSDGISVKIYTPWDRGENSFEQRSLSTDGCLIIDLTKGTYLDELIQCARIDTFERNNSAMATSSMIAILQKKNAEHTEREKRAEDILKECLRNADYYQNGSKLDLASTDPKKRFALGMEKAILNKFHALNYVENFAGRTDDISTALRDSQAESLVDPVESDANSKALNEILRYVSDERRWSRQVSLKGLIEHFRKAPYGYREIDIRFMVAKLLNRNRLKAKIHDVVQNPSSQDFVWKFTRGGDDAYISIEEQKKVDQALITKARAIMKNAFDVSYEMKERKLCDDSLAFFRSKLEQLKQITYSQRGDYPGKEYVTGMISLFSDITSSDDPESVFNRILQNESRLNEYGERMDSILAFYQDSSSQRRIWDNANSLIRYHDDNRLLIPGIEKMDTVIDEMDTIVKDPYPFNQIQHLGELVNEANRIKASIVAERKERAKKDIESAYFSIEVEMEKFKAKADSDSLGKAQGRYEIAIQLKDELLSSLDDESKIDLASRRASQELEDFRKELVKILNSHSSEQAEKNIRRKSVSSSSLIPIASRKIKSQQDIKDLVESIQQKLSDYLTENDEVDID